MHQPATGLRMRFQALDGWRGIAALLVVVYHIPFFGHFYPIPLVRNAYLFVDLFFVLSGFIISRVYADRLGDVRSVVAFLIRRFGRVWPLHAAILAIFVGIEALKFAGLCNGLALHHAPFSSDHGIGAIMANLALLHAFGLYDHLTWNSPSWSISVEFWTYVAFAAVFFFWPRRSLAVAVSIAVLAPIAILVLSNHSPVADVTYDYGALRCLFGFSIGHLTHRVFSTRATICSQRWAGSWWPLIAEATAVLGIAGFVTLAGDGAATMAGPLVFATAIYVFAHEGGPISRLLRSKPARRLGDWSYSIYMTHLLVITVLIEVCGAFEKVAGMRLLRPVAGIDGELFALAVPHSVVLADGLTLICLGFTVAVSALTFRFIEMPGREYFARLADRIRGAAATGTRVIPTVVGQIAPLHGAATPGTATPSGIGQIALARPRAAILAADV